MSLKSKILIGQGVILLIIGSVVLWAVLHIVDLGRAGDAILSENYRSIHAAENMIGQLERQHRGLLLIALGERDNGLGMVRDGSAEFAAWLSRAADNVTVPGERELIADIGRRARELRTAAAVVAEARDPEPGHRLARHRAEVLPGLEALMARCVELRRLNEDTMFGASRRARDLAARALWSTTLVTAVALLVALLFGLVLAGRIVSPARRLMEAARRIAAGDYGVSVPEQPADELGALGAEFNRMAVQLARFAELNIDKIITEKNTGQAILASIEDPLIVLDPRARVTTLNPAARRLLETDGGQAEGWDIGALVPDDGLVARIRRTLHDGVPPQVQDESAVLKLETGEVIRFFLASVTAIRGRDQRLLGAVLMLRDVTRLKEVERMKSDFVMAASHELRTPLTGLGMSVELLTEALSGKLPERERDLLRSAGEEARRMNALVDDLLNLSRLEAGRIEMERETTPVATVLGHAMSVFVHQAEMKGVRLQCSPPEDGLEVRLDPNKIAWVLSNLISNALRYVSPGGLVELTAGGSANHVWFSVKDDGPGIPPEYRQRIFQKFIQVRGQEGGGSGLGLAICKEIVRAHGGSIWVESEPGRGSDFRFHIPRN